VRPGVKADRISRTPAVQGVSFAVLLAVHPDRARAQHRAGQHALGRLAGDHRGHVAVAALPAVAGRQDHEPGPVGRALFHRDLDRTARLEADQAHQRSGLAAIDRSRRARVPIVSECSAWVSGKSARAEVGVPGAVVRAGMDRTASASLAISGATDMSAVNGTSFVSVMGRR
jgi:hypothetical protein